MKTRLSKKTYTLKNSKDRDQIESNEDTDTKPSDKKRPKKDKATSNEIQPTNPDQLKAIDGFLALAFKCERPEKPQPFKRVLHSKLLNKENINNYNSITKYNQYFVENDVDLEITSNTKCHRNPIKLLEKKARKPIAIIDEPEENQYRLRLYKHYFILKGDKRAETMGRDDTVDYEDYLQEIGQLTDTRDKEDLVFELDHFCNLAEQCHIHQTPLVNILKTKNYNTERYENGKTVGRYNENYLACLDLTITSGQIPMLRDKKFDLAAIARIAKEGRKLQVAQHYFKLKGLTFPHDLAQDGWIDYDKIKNIHRSQKQIIQITKEIKRCEEFVNQCSGHFLQQLNEGNKIDITAFFDKLDMPYISLHAYQQAFTKQKKAHLNLSFRINVTASGDTFLYLLHDDLNNLNLVGLTGQTFAVRTFAENYPNADISTLAIKETIPDMPDDLQKGPEHLKSTEDNQKTKIDDEDDEALNAKSSPAKKLIPMSLKNAKANTFFKPNDETIKLIKPKSNPELQGPKI